MRLKTYLVTLLIFLIFLYGGILFILTFSLRDNISNIKERALGEHYFMISSYYNDLSHVEYRKKSEIDDKTNKGIDIEEELLFDSYFICYQKQPVYLGLLKNDVVIKSTLPNISSDFNTNLDMNKRRVFYNTENNKNYLFILGNLPKPFHYLTVIYCYDLSAEIENWNDMCKLFFSFSFILSVILAIVLYIVIYYIFKPLTEITAAAEKIAKGDYSSISVKVTEEDKFESTNIIMSESKRLQDISQRLLKLALYREQDMKFSCINLSDIIKKILTSFKIRLNEKNIQVILESEDFIIKGDEALIECLFSNIIDNAVKACDKNGKIIIKSSKDNNEYINVTIYDNGKEIPKDSIKHLTEAFYRVDKSRNREDGGAGIGLTLCNEIVLKHNAMLHFSSDSTGTTVKLTFTK